MREPVEKRLAHAIGSGAQALGIYHRYRCAPVLTADDADLLRNGFLADRAPVWVEDIAWAWCDAGRWVGSSRCSTRSVILPPASTSGRWRWRCGRIRTAIIKLIAPIAGSILLSLLHHVQVFSQETTPERGNTRAIAGSARRTGRE